MAAIYYTQGGGFCILAGKNRIFVKEPPTPFKIGDFVPEQWDMISVNQEAKNEMEDDLERG